MRLDKIFDQLTYGELAQVFVGGGEDESISPENRKKILYHISLGLTDLHKRFNLKEGRITLVPEDDVFIYRLSSEYAESNAEETVFSTYIKDTEQAPFEDDILKVERVYDQDGEELPLNDLENPESVRTSSANVLVLPFEHELKELTIVYRADHPVLDRLANLESPEDVEVDLPRSHLWALLLFVASRVMNPVGMAAEFHEGNNYAAKYEKACQALAHQNLEVDTLNSNTRFRRNGWV